MTKVGSEIRRVGLAPAGTADFPLAADAAGPEQLAVATAPGLHALERQAIESNSLAAVIHRAILSVAPGRIETLRVASVSGAIVLEGRCRTYYCKQIAQTVAMDLARGVRVHNQIEVLRAEPQ